jgi:hypothetical protein
MPILDLGVGASLAAEMPAFLIHLVFVAATTAMITSHGDLLSTS